MKHLSAKVTAQPWQPIDTAPKLHELVIEGMLPDGSVKRMRWASGGGWAGQFGPGITGRVAWLMFNDTHQPVAWRRLGDVCAPDKPSDEVAEQERINLKFGAAYAEVFGLGKRRERRR